MLVTNEKKSFVFDSVATKKYYSSLFTIEYDSKRIGT